MAGFWSRLLGVDSYDAAQRVLSEPYEPFVSTAGVPVMDPGTPLAVYGRAEVEHFWRTQPALRKVVGFVARNVASIPLHTHERVGDADRRRVTDHPLPRVLSRPQPRVGAYRFWESVISDGLLYDRWAVLKDWQVDDGSLQLLQIPSWRLYLKVNQFRIVTDAFVWVGDTDLVDRDEEPWIPLDLDDLIFDHGYAPRSAGLSPVDTLKDLLEESDEAVEYRREMWRNGGRATQYIKRPETAKWSDEQRQRFMNGLRKFLKGGDAAGGTMLLEDGMEAGSLPQLSPSDTNDLDGRTLTQVEVAAAFYVAPELIGIREGNFSNVDAFRQSLYRDSLGPYITAWEQAINVGLTDDLADGRNLYVEANVEAKLRGSFQEQAQVMQPATGAPWLTRNEARALQNRSPVRGGDELVVPLNVLTGGQASPRDSGSQNRIASKGAPVQVKSGPSVTQQRKAEQVISEFFAKQRRTVVSRLGANDVDWWDGDRWDDDLSARMLGLYLLTSTAAGQETLESIGIDPGSYDEPRTMKFLQESARKSAESMNSATLAALQDAMAVGDDDEIPDPVDAASHVFDVAEDSRSAEAGLTAVAFAAGFGAVEAARQNTSRARKRWVVTSGNPRASHAAMDGEEVGIDDVFSSGQRWPGQYNGDPDETAGCECELEIVVD